MTDDQVSLVKNSFVRLEPLAEEVAVLFYARLFKLDPSLRPLFKADIREQGFKLMQMLRLVVDSLDDVERLIPELHALGARHAAYKVEDGHYQTVGSALLWTFEKALKPDYPPETEEAWNNAYDLLARIMKEGSHASERAAVS
jgi:hemoglobin-like flavoprotein